MAKEPRHPMVEMARLWEKERWGDACWLPAPPPGQGVIA